MSDTPDTHALLDTENLFRGFRARRGPKDRERGRLIRHFPTVTPEVSVALGALATHDFVDWLEDRYQLEARCSFGKRHDPGVEAARETLEVRGFTHRNVPEGKNKADIAVVEATRGLVGEGDMGRIALGGEDNLVLAAAADICDRSGGAWTFLVVMPDSKTQQWLKFDPGGAYEKLEACALDLILEERRQLRRANVSLRAQRRRLALSLRRFAHRELTGQSESRNFVQAVRVICAVGRLPPPGWPPTQHWMSSTATRLADAGLGVPIAHALVSWIGEFQDNAAGRAASSPHEQLLTAAIEVFGGDEFDPRTASATRTFVARNHPEFLTPLERAIACVWSSDYSATRTG